MARPTITQALVPSVFDRLLDFDPSHNVETPSSRGQVIKELRESVRRDLELLLNTRQRCVPLADEWQPLEKSIINYGIPDYTGVNLDLDNEREKFAVLIEKIILQNESRFRSVKITLMNDPNSIDRTFRFRIDGILKVEPAVKPVVFDSSLEPVTRNFNVKDLDGG